MYVFSYLELHTLLIGWMLYDLLWAAFAETGIVAIPFVWILLRHFRKSATEGNDMDKNTHNDGKSLAIELILAFLVLLFVALPIVTIQPTTLTFSPQPSFSNPTPTTVTGASDPSTYNDTLGPVVASGSAQIPIWWGVMIGISSGITNAVIQNLPTPGDLREARVMLSSNNIENPNLAHEYRSFVTNCYVPAKNRFEERVVDGRIDASTVNPGDVDWPGGAYLRTMPGGYAVCTDPDSCGSTLRPIGVRGMGDSATCNEWWTQLESDIYEADSVNNSVWQNIQANVSSFTGLGVQQLREARVRNLINNLNATSITTEYNYGQGQGGAIGALGSLWGAVEDMAGTVAIGGEAISRSGMINVMKQAVPIMLAIITMVLYFMMPAALIFTTYSIGAVVALSFAVFSLVFTHALMAVASWLDYYLIVSLFDDFSLLSWLSSDAHLLGTTQKRWLINIIVGGLYVGMPMIWLYVMGIAGIGAGRATGFLLGHASGAGMGAGGSGMGAGGAGARSAGAASAAASRAGSLFKR